MCGGFVFGSHVALDVIGVVSDDVVGDDDAAAVVDCSFALGAVLDDSYPVGTVAALGRTDHHDCDY